MRKFLFIGSLAGNFFFLAYVMYISNFCSHKTACTSAFNQTSAITSPVVATSGTLAKVGEKNSANNYAIAILTPASHPALEQVQKGFEETLCNARGIACNFTVYNANGNRTLMRSQVEEIIQKQYDLIFTIGAHATQMAKEVTTKKQSTIPIVFGAVADPVRLNLIKSEASSDNHLTGAATTTNYPDQMALLLALKPNTKRALIVYDPTQSSGLEKDKREVEVLLTQRGVTVSSIEVYKTSEVHQRVAPLISGSDVVVIFKDNTVVAGIDSLVKLCTRYGVTLVASDLDSVDRGAVLGFGVHEYSFGAASAERALHVLVEKKHPSKIPVTMATDYKIKLNTKMLQSQGLAIEASKLLLMKSVEVV